MKYFMFIALGLEYTMADGGPAKKRRKIEIIANENALQENITRDLGKKLMAHCMKEMNEVNMLLINLNLFE